MIVEKFYDGKDYRVIIFDYFSFAACRRESLMTIGNGMNTVLELLKEN